MAVSKTKTTELAHVIDQVVGAKEVEIHCDGQCTRQFLPDSLRSLETVDPVGAMVYKGALMRVLDVGGGICIYRPCPVQVIAGDHLQWVEEVFGIQVEPLRWQALSAPALQALFDKAQGPKDRPLKSHRVFRSL